MGYHTKEHVLIHSEEMTLIAVGEHGDPIISWRRWWRIVLVMMGAFGLLLLLQYCLGFSFEFLLLLDLILIHLNHYLDVLPGYSLSDHGSDGSKAGWLFLISGRFQMIIIIHLSIIYHYPLIIIKWIIQIILLCGVRYIGLNFPDIYSSVHGVSWNPMSLGCCCDCWHQ